MGCQLLVLWTWRNKHNFKTQIEFPKSMRQIILKFINQISLANKMMSSVANLKASKTIEIKWNSPPIGQVNLNINGASRGNLGQVNCGGILCDKEGRWLRGFSCNLGIFSSFIAKLWGELHGVKMVWNLGYKFVILESNSNLLIELIKKSLFEHEENQTLLTKCLH